MFSRGSVDYRVQRVVRTRKPIVRANRDDGSMKAVLARASARLQRQLRGMGPGLWVHLSVGMELRMEV